MIGRLHDERLEELETLSEFAACQDMGLYVMGLKH